MHVMRRRLMGKTKQENKTRQEQIVVLMDA
jgi:hypothetical protein